MGPGRTGHPECHEHIIHIGPAFIGSDRAKVFRAGMGGIACANQGWFGRDGVGRWESFAKHALHIAVFVCYDLRYAMESFILFHIVSLPVTK
jgi:hypothetical protein